MKNLLCVLVLTISWLVSFSQREPILTRGGKYEPSNVKSFALGSDAKANSFKQQVAYLVNKKLQEAAVEKRITANDDDIKMVFDSTQIDEVDLKAETFRNSCWDVSSQQVIFGKPSLTAYSGFAGITRLYGVTFVLYKYDCVNLLDAPVLKIKIVEKPKPAPIAKKEPEPELKKVNDTVYKTTTVLEEEYIHSTRMVNDYPDYYGGMSILGWLFMPRMNCYYPCYDRGVYNTYVNNYGFYGVQGSHRPSTPPPHRYEGGGRIDVPTDNHRYMGGGRSNDNYTTGEGGGRADDSYTTGQGGGRSAVVSRDNMGRIVNSQVSSVNNNRRVNTSSNNPTVGMVSRSSGNYSSGSTSINTRLANRISGNTSGYSGYSGGSRRISSGQMQQRSFNPSAIQRSSGFSGGGNGLMRSPMGGRR